MLNTGHWLIHYNLQSFGKGIQNEEVERDPGCLSSGLCPLQCFIVEKHYTVLFFPRAPELFMFGVCI